MGDDEDGGSTDEDTVLLPVSQLSRFSMRSETKQRGTGAKHKVTAMTWADMVTSECPPPGPARERRTGCPGVSGRPRGAAL